MNMTTYSPALVLLFVWALLWILMDIHFRELTRAQKWLAPLLILSLAAFNHVLRLQIGAAALWKIIPLTMHLPFFLIFLYLAKCGVIKMTFMILSALIFTAPTVIVSGLVQRFLSGGSWAILLSNLIAYAVTLLFAQFIFRRGFNYLLKYGDNRLFLRFSIVPLLYYIYVFAAQNNDFSSFTSVSGYMVRYLPTVEVFVFYFLLLHSYKTLSEKREMEALQAVLTQELDAAEEQLTLLGAVQTQTAIYRHNMRHHLNAVEGFLSVGKPEQARDYIQKVRSDVEAITPKRFCENEIVNLLCSSFSGKAERMGVQLKAAVKLPQELSVSDTELCSVLSNGLENALHAVSTLEETFKWVELYCGIRLNKLLIEIKNPYSGEIVMRDGLPVSGREGHGYGCRSIRSIAAQNEGLCMFAAEHGVFTLRVMLPLPGFHNGQQVH